MPIYSYTDDTECINIDVSHGMNDTVVVYCPRCGRAMYKKIQAPNVNWNGLPPHLDHNNPVVREMVKGAPKRRDEYAKIHEG